MTTARDRLIEKALEDIEVPEHGSEFWETIDSSLAGSGRARSERSTDDSLAEVMPISSRQTLRRRFPLAAVAAAAALLLGGAAVTTRLVRDDTVATVGTSTDPEPRPSPSSGDGTSAPDEVARTWLEALGSGDTSRAAQLLGPRSLRYIEALGGTAEGFMIESQESWGAWPGAPDLSTTEIELGTVGGSEVVIVVLSGTLTREGTTASRVEALPAVQAGDGSWLVEPFAFDPSTGGRIEMINPLPMEGGGFEALSSESVIEVGAPAAGQFYFSLEDSDPVKVSGAPNGGGTKGSWDPPGQLRQGRHLLVVTYANAGTLSSLAVVVEVA